MVVLLWPMVSKILAFNYSDRYSYYNVGGIAVELYYHAMRTGLLNLILILFGLWLCVKRKKPSLPVLALCELMLSMLLFTRVQNSGSHQMLLYVPAYVILFLCGAAGRGREYRAFQKYQSFCFLGLYTVVRRVGAVLPAHCHGLARVRYPCVPPGGPC